MQPQDKKGRDTDATQGANGATVWLPVARVAQLEGVSVRAVQRRCQSGKYRSRRVETPQGERLEVDAATLTTHATPGRDVGSQERRDTRDAGAALASPTAKDAAPDFAARYVEQLESENGFLRRALEQRDRDAAELRAALREALRAQPRQLEAPAKSPEAAPERAPIAAPLKDTPDAQTPAKSPGNAKEPRPLWKLLLGIR